MLERLGFAVRYDLLSALKRSVLRCGSAARKYSVQSGVK